MLIYLDMCCLKRPFDDQSQPRIRLETEAVLDLLAMETKQMCFIRSTALLLENQFNPIRERASRVDQWLRAEPIWSPSDPEALLDRVKKLGRLGLKNFDALHLASAEQAGAKWFVTVDDRLLAAATRREDSFGTQACSAVDCAKELTT